MENNRPTHIGNLPSEKWYHSCKNRNNEICKDWEFENIYDWLDDDVDYIKKSAIEHKEMVNKFRKRMGWEEIV